jgi:hypothetical protein
MGDDRRETLFIELLMDNELETCMIGFYSIILSVEYSSLISFVKVSILWRDLLIYKCHNDINDFSVSIEASKFNVTIMCFEGSLCYEAWQLNYLRGLLDSDVTKCQLWP